MILTMHIGTRNCIGKTLAINEMQLAVATVIRKFRVELRQRYDEELFQNGWKDFLT